MSGQSLELWSRPATEISRGEVWFGKLKHSTASLSGPGARKQVGAVPHKYKRLLHTA